MTNVGARGRTRSCRKRVSLRATLAVRAAISGRWVRASCSNASVDMPGSTNSKRGGKPVSERNGIPVSLLRRRANSALQKLISCWTPHRLPSRSSASPSARLASPSLPCPLAAKAADIFTTSATSFADCCKACKAPPRRPEPDKHWRLLEESGCGWPARPGCCSVLSGPRRAARRKRRPSASPGRCPEWRRCRHPNVRARPEV